MAKKYGLPTNIGLIFIIALVVVGLFSLTTVFAASESGLLGRRVNVEATAQLIRLQNKQAQMETAAAQELSALEAQIEEARQSLDTFQKSAKTQTAQQTNQLVTLQQQIVDKQATVKSLEANLIQVRQNIKSDDETFTQAMITLETDMEQLKTGLLNDIQSIDAQLSAAQARLDALPTITPTPPIHNVDDTQPDDSNDKHESSSDDKDESADDKKEEVKDKDEDEKEEDDDKDEDKSKDESEKQKEEED